MSLAFFKSADRKQQVKRSPAGFWASMVILLLFTVGVVEAKDPTRTIDDVLAQYQERVQKRLKPRFDFVNVAWPPEKVALVAFKDTRLLELWSYTSGTWQHIKDYRVKGMSGKRGPKLREGDYQVPEGRYQIELLNPNSAYHLSLKLDYPNDYDRQQAEVDGRNDLGGDIFIHGGRLSKGCIAIGNSAAEELFILTALIGESNVSVLIAPRDFRFRPQTTLPVDAPIWIGDLNQQIATQLLQFPLAEKSH